MTEYLHTINASIDQVRSIVTELFTQEDQIVVPFSASTLQIARSKKGVSTASGALIGSNFYLSQNLQFGTGPHDRTLVRYLLSMESAIIGGALGMRKVVEIHAEYAEKLVDALQA